ncbi:MAG TPA: hypothetical protein VGX03_21805 [Candidatus Binatia bacterium]|jgi:hypothetical protein|nr:hypothetical protein [Candidatus Binatia bacterium]
MEEIVAEAGQLALVQERSDKPGESSAEKVEVLSGQMEKIKSGVEALLRDEVPLHLLKPVQAWRRITDHLKSTGVNARELPHESTYKRFREKYRQKYGLR